MSTEMGLRAKIEELEQENRKLRHQATRDGLTGALRREAFFEIIEKRRSFGLLPREMTLVLCDIDFFKKVNDTHGHFAGDEVLKAVSKELESKLPEGALLCRMGGEEFAVLLPLGTDAAMTTMNKVREDLQSFSVAVGRKSLSVTLSFGLCEWDSDESLLASAARADAALYESKRNGRNRCTLARAA